MKIMNLVPPCLILALLFGCGKPAEKETTSTVELPPVFVEKALTGTPTPIPEARQNLKAGDEVLLTGLIMGVMHPFVEGRAVFVLGDEATLTPCDLNEGDGCLTPWDTCCDPATIRMAGTATIQLVDADGTLLRTGLKGSKGLNELSRITVSGTVAPNSSPQAFIVNANAIHIGVR
jgi:hypothetical protein